MIYEIETLFTGYTLVGSPSRQTIISDDDGVAENSRKFYIVNNRNPIINAQFNIGRKSTIKILRLKIETVGAKGLRTSPIVVPAYIAEDYCGHTATISLRQLGNNSPLYQQKSKIVALNEWIEQDTILAYFGNDNLGNERFFQLDNFNISYDSLNMNPVFNSAVFAVKVKMQVLATEEV